MCVLYIYIYKMLNISDFFSMYCFEYIQENMIADDLFEQPVTSDRQIHFSTFNALQFMLSCSYRDFFRCLE